MPGIWPDLKIFNKALVNKLAPGKKVEADKGYRGNAKCVTPCDYRIKSRIKKASTIRSCHESVNGRLKNFNCLKQVFCHGVDNHKSVFEAVVVLVQLSVAFGGENLWETEY